MNYKTIFLPANPFFGVAKNLFRKTLLWMMGFHGKKNLLLSLLREKLSK